MRESNPIGIIERIHPPQRLDQASRTSEIIGKGTDPRAKWIGLVDVGGDRLNLPARFEQMGGDSARLLLRESSRQSSAAGAEGAVWRITADRPAVGIQIRLSLPV